MTDEELRKLAGYVVDEMFARLTSRPANDTRQRVRRHYAVDPTVERDDIAEEMARQALQRRGIPVR